MYPSAYVPGLQYERGINRFFRYHRGQPPCAALMNPMTQSLVAALEDLRPDMRFRWFNYSIGRAKRSVPTQAAV